MMVHDIEVQRRRTVDNRRMRARAKMAWGFIIAVVLSIIALAMGGCTFAPERDPAAMREITIDYTNSIPADGEQWVNDSVRRGVLVRRAHLVPSEGMMSLTRAEIDSIQRACWTGSNPSYIPAVHCRADAEGSVFTPERVEAMLTTQPRR